MPRSVTVDEWDVMMLVFGNDRRQRERIISWKYNLTAGEEVEVGDGGPVSCLFTVPEMGDADFVQTASLGTENVRTSGHFTSVRILFAAARALRGGWKADALLALLNGPPRDATGSPLPFCNRCNRTYEHKAGLLTPEDDEGVRYMVCPFCLRTPRELETA